MFVVDTSVVSLIIRPTSTLELYRPELESGAPLYVSVRTVAELMLGAELDGWGHKRRAALSSLIETSYSVLPIDDKTVTSYVQLMAGSMALGRRLSDPDTWIAAAAMQYGMTLSAHDRAMKVAEEFGVKVVCRL